MNLIEINAMKKLAIIFSIIILVAHSSFSQQLTCQQQCNQTAEATRTSVNQTVAIKYTAAFIGYIACIASTEGIATIWCTSTYVAAKLAIALEATSQIQALEAIRAICLAGCPPENPSTGSTGGGTPCSWCYCDPTLCESGGWSGWNDENTNEWSYNPLSFTTVYQNFSPVECFEIGPLTIDEFLISGSGYDTGCGNTAWD